MTTTRQPIELVMWETVRRDMKYPIEDNNNGYIYGINHLSCDDINEAEIIDVTWFKTAQERQDVIDGDNMIIINEIN